MAVDAGPIHASQIAALIHTSPVDLFTQLTGLFGHALAAWLLLAIPAVALLTYGLTLLLRRVPVMAPAEAATKHLRCGRRSREARTGLVISILAAEKTAEMELASRENSCLLTNFALGAHCNRARLQSCRNIP